MKKFLSILTSVMLSASALFAAPTTPINNAVLTGVTNIPSGNQFKLNGSGGSSGQFLSTDGSGNVSWGTGTNTLPSQTSNAGKVVTTDGTNASWTLYPTGVSNTINPRAPRQGLVFDGSAGATVNVAGFGTGAGTLGVIVNPSTWSNSPRLFSTADGSLQFYINAGVPTLYTTGGSVTGPAITVGESSSVVAVINGNGTAVIYTNAVAGSSGSITANLTQSIVYFGGSGSSILTGVLNGWIWNRALAATGTNSVLALYEQGTPGAADYNNATNTSNTTGFTNSGYTTFSGVTATGFTAAQASGNSYIATNPASNTLTGRAGTSWLVTFTATLTSGAAPTFGLRDNNATDEGLFTVTAGANSAIITMAKPFVSDGVGVGVFRNIAATSFAISNFSLTPLGLLLAPGDSSGGSGTIWYDESGNANNISWTSGINWNRPSVNITAKNIYGNPTVQGNLTVTGSLIGTANQQWKFGSQAAMVGDGTTLYLYAGGTGGYVFRNHGDSATSATLSESGNFVATGSITPSSTAGIVGTTTNDNANAGSVGEYVTSNVASGSGITLTNSTNANLTSITLTAGDWMVFATPHLTGMTTGTAFTAGPSASSATFDTSSGDRFAGLPLTTTVNDDASLHLTSRFKLSGTTTIYLVVYSAFSAGTVKAYGNLSATRVR